MEVWVGRARGGDSSALRLSEKVFSKVFRSKYFVIRKVTATKFYSTSEDCYAHRAVSSKDANISVLRPALPVASNVCGSRKKIEDVLE